MGHPVPRLTPAIKAAIGSDQAAPVDYYRQIPQIEPQAIPKFTRTPAIGVETAVKCAHNPPTDSCMDAHTHIRTRFAPSPTGRLHLGHALAARVAHDLARSQPGGRFLLRFEDIDAPRVRAEFYQEIEEDLQWLGFHWDETPLRQTTRSAAYKGALAQLRERNLVYPCFCTRREIQNEIAHMAAAPHGPEGPIYPGTCSHLSVSERVEKCAAGLPHAWRLHARLAATSTGPLTFLDLRFGTIPVDPDLLGDVVLARKEIGTAYHLAVVVDDAFQHITHVTRGEDLLPSTHVHRLLQALLGLPEPVYLHHELAMDEHGKRLAKRHDALSIAALRAAGLTPNQALSKIPPVQW